MPRMPALRALAACAVLLAACGGSGAATTTDSGERSAAREFAATADRALDGTRFTDLEGEALATLILDLCRGEEPPLGSAAAVVAGVEAPSGTPQDDAILLEVLLTGVAEVCPERALAEVSAAYLASVRTIVATQDGVALDDGVALTTGLSACAVLDAGTPTDALVVIAAGAFGIEAEAEVLLAGALDPPNGVTAGAVLASAATYLCPEHADRVGEFAGSLSGATPSG